MSNCKTFQTLIEKYIDGTISESQLAELQEHTKTCQSCREDFEKCTLIQKTIKHAFSPTMSAERAKESVMDRLDEKPSLKASSIGYKPTWPAGKRAAIAACALLAAGLLFGFVLGRINTTKPARESTARTVAIQVSELTGTVLVKHEGSEAWQTLKPDSKIHIGDTFHSVAGSAFTLELGDKSTIEVEQNSMLALTSYNGQTQFFLEHGKCKAALESPHPPFFISTPHGRAEALGTEFTVTVE